MKFPYIKEAISSLFQKPSTERYPFVKKDAPAGYRGKIVFHSDRCIGCGMCTRVCAGSAITKTSEKTNEGEKITMEFNLGSCTFCQMCADFCPRGAIELTREYSMVTDDKETLKVGGSFIKKIPNRPTAPKTIDK